VSLYTSSHVATPRSGVAAVPRGDLEGLVDVVDREGHGVHADLVGPGGLGLDRVGVDGLEELEASVAVRCLQHGDVGVVAVEAEVSAHSPLTVSRPSPTSSVTTSAMSSAVVARLTYEMPSARMCPGQ